MAGSTEFAWTSAKIRFSGREIVRLFATMSAFSAQQEENGKLITFHRNYDVEDACFFFVHFKFTLKLQFHKHI